MPQPRLFCKSMGEKAIIFAMKFNVSGILIHASKNGSSTTELREFFYLTFLVTTLCPVFLFNNHGVFSVLSAVDAFKDDLKKFFEKVEINAPGELIYKPVKAAVSDQGRKFLEVHRDIYGKIKNLTNEALQVIGQPGVSDKVNWERGTPC